MAILKDFIGQVTFDEVWALLSAESEDVAEYRQAYENIFAELQEAQPQENTGHMTIRFVEEEAPLWDFYFDDAEEDSDAPEAAEEAAGPVLQVYGFVPGDDEGYAIGLKPPEVLVGLDVAPETEKAYPPRRSWPTAWRR